MNKISNDELGKKAYTQVKSMIISKKLKPGQKIVQDKLAEELGISRTPLRSALQMLEGESLIESIPRRGVVVKEFTDKEVVEIYDCRAALEGTAIRLFTEKAQEADVNSLKEMFAPFIKGDVDVRNYQEADSQFHEFIISQCGNDFLCKLFNHGNLIVCIDMIGLIRPPEETLAEHLDIIKAVEQRNADLAETLLKQHLNRSKQLIVDKIINE